MDGGELMQELLAFKKALNMELDSVFMFNFSNLKLFYVNQAAIKQLGYSHKELLQMSLLDINPDWTKKQAHQLLMPLIKGLQASLKIETIHQHKNTTLIQVEALFEYITIKDAFFVAKIRDITERKRAQAQLQQAAQTEKIIPIDFNLPDFLDSVVELMKIQAQEKNILLSYEVVYSLPKFVRTDEKSLRQILINLLSNAIKFTDQAIVRFKVIYYEDIIRFEIDGKLFSFEINVIYGPSPTEAAKLFNLVMSGNVKKILANVTELEQQNNELLTFAEQVKNLIKGFEMSELKKFIKQYIKE